MINLDPQTSQPQMQTTNQILTTQMTKEIPLSALLDPTSIISQLQICCIRTTTLSGLALEFLPQILTNTYVDSNIESLKLPLFQLQLKDKHKTWRIIKSLQEFLTLEGKLKDKYNRLVPKVPIRSNQLINSSGKIQQLLEFFGVFLKKLAYNQEIREEGCFRRFIENLLPPDRNKMKIYKQMTLRKKAGGRFGDTKFKKIISHFTKLEQKFFNISSEGVFYTSGKDELAIQQSISFSKDFKLQYGILNTYKIFQIKILCSHRILTVNAGTIQKFVMFIYFLKKAMKESDLLAQHRFRSFAQVRQNCNAQYFIDGKDYFSNLHDAMLTAKKQIFITGWMISPYFCLKRPDPQQQTRLDRVLSNIANNGIKINIIVYMQPKVALRIDSQFTQNYLTSLSDNIKVLRHPAYLLIPFLWSHHQKMVIIDQQIAFMGGLDIGYGRYDDNRHLLSDAEEENWPGVDYCNYRKTDILFPKKYQQSSVKRQEFPRMPWHDIAIRISGGAVIDLSRHFVQYWNYVNFQMSMDQRELLLYAGYTEGSENSNTQNKDRFGNSIKSNFAHSKMSIFKPEEEGKDPQRVTFAIAAEDNSSEEQVFMLPRQSLIPNQQLQFYSLHVRQMTSKQNIQNFIKKLNPNQLFFNRNAVNFEQLIVTKTTNELKQSSKGNQSHQMLRSASMWGLGLQQGMTEKSILNAYIQLITQAKQFIYIQNQFFISVKNKVAQTITNRIIRAHQLKEKFRVIVVIPFLPGFDGQPQRESSALIRIQIHLIYQTICRGSNSIFRKLSNEIGEEFISEYIKFFCLRTHGILNDKAVTQLIYVHSKCMIVDDQYVLVGSANINDRSLQGTRDSEIAVVVQDQQKSIVKCLDGSEREVRRFAHQMRKEIFIQHFGMNEEEVANYLDQKFWKTISVNAERNHIFYRNVFGCYPDSQIQKYKDIAIVRENADISQYEILKGQVIGNACPFQQDFLKNQNLTIKAGQKQFLLPSINFT